MEPLQSSDHFLERDSESEKSALKSTLPSTPVEQQPPRSRIFGLRRPCCSEESSYGSKTKARKLGTKLLHFVILITVFVGFLGPTAYKHLSTLWKQNHVMSHPPDHADCVERAVWTPLDDIPGSPHYPRFQYAASTSFEFTRFSDLLYFMSSGSFANGVISVTNDAEVATDTVQVEVVASYSSPETFEQVDVCSLHRGGDENKNGVGIFTPHFWPHPNEHRMHFYIHVKLPFPEGGSEGQNLYYNDLETRLPLFSHYIGDLQRTAAFHTVDLQSTNTPVDVESLLAEQVFVKATNGHIKGLYNVTNRIELGTTNGAIKAVTNLESDGTSEATASLHSTNGPVIADFHLHSSTADRAKGVFRINTVSSNSVVEANFPVAPNSHTLYLKAHTSNSPISVNLHKTFEGTFSLGSSRWIPPTIQYDPEATDPSGEGRRRKVQYIRPQRGHMSGSVSWSAVERTDLGVVEASTSNSPAHITL